MTTIPLSAADTRRLDLINIERTGEPARQAENMDTANRAKPLSRQMLTLGLNLVAPIVLYYGLRAAGVGIYPALIIGAVAPLLSAVVKIVRREPVEGLSLFMLTMLLLSSLVSLLNGSPRFLPAKDGRLTAVSGVWMLCSVRSRRPLTFLFARPLLEGRWVFTAESWDSLWERLPRFRHIWRVATWGIALLTDAIIRVVMAYTLPIDLVPGLNGALWPVTFVLLQVVDIVYFHRAGFYRMPRAEIAPS
jgi:intracellular septation protein A